MRNPRLHGYLSFAGSLLETAAKSLHLSCGSELRISSALSGDFRLCVRLRDDQVSAVALLAACVQRARELYDRRESPLGQMFAVVHQLHDRGERLEVVPFAGQQRVLSEERNDPHREGGDASRFVFQRPVGSIGPDRAVTEGPLEELQDFGAVAVLADREAGSDVPAEPVSRAAVEGHCEAAFAVRVAREVRRLVQIVALQTPACCGAR